MRCRRLMLPVLLVLALGGCSRTALELPVDESDVGAPDVASDATTLPDVPLADVNVSDTVSSRETECRDGLDNDGDGAADCDDDDCLGVCNQFEFQCSDGIDDDQDGPVDCDDPDCERRCVIGRTEFDCFDGFDNDQNGATDCADTQCVEACAQPQEFDCFNRFDDDNDGRVDCDDSDCADQCVASDREFDCFDGVDNDRDGDLDCDDRDCRRQCGPGPEPGDGACANPQDSQWFNDNDPNDALNACIEPCVERIEDRCIGDCMEDEGLTGPCATCFDELIVCYAFECGDACQFDEEQCNACFEDRCLPPLQACSGLGF